MKKYVNGFNKMSASNSRLYTSLHAEISACKNLSKIASRLKLNLSTVDLIVLRISRNKSINLSRPCYHCIKQLNKYCKMLNFKLRYIYYSNSDGTIIKEKFDNLLNSNLRHISKGSR